MTVGRDSPIVAFPAVKRREGIDTWLIAAVERKEFKRKAVAWVDRLPRFAILFSFVGVIVLTVVSMFVLI